MIPDDEPIQAQFVDSDMPAEVAVDDAVREQAFDTVHAWRGVPLQPFSKQRERLFEKLQLLDAPMPTQLRQAHPQLLLPDAEKVLFLCSSSREQLLPMLPFVDRLLDAAMEWGGQNIVGEVEQVAAIRLASRIVSDTAETQAVERPSRSGGSLGN